MARFCEGAKMFGTQHERMLTNVDESAVVLDTLHGTARGLLLLLLLGDLGSLAAHLASTR